MKKRLKVDDEEIPLIEELPKRETKIAKDEEISQSEKLATVFENSRHFWLEKISELSKDFKNINKLTDLQCDLFSNRQILLEQKHKLYDRVSKLNAALNSQKKEKHLHYTNHYEIRLSPRDKDAFIDTDLSEDIKIISLIDNHISYLDNSLKTLDNMIYGIKYRVTMYEMLQK